MHRGYLPIWRKFFEEHPFWKEKRKFSKAEAWIDILKETHFHEEPKQRLIKNAGLVTINYGECVMTTRYCAQRWGWSLSSVHRFYILLEKMEQISVFLTTKVKHFKVINFELYDPRRNDIETGAERERNGSGTGAERTKEDKEYKDCKENSKYPNGYSSSKHVSNDEKISNCPQKEIIKKYQAILPQLPQIQVWDKTSEKNLTARWRQDERHQTIEFWISYFEWVSKSDFLMGRKTDFQADLHWLVKPTNFAKVINGRYHNKQNFHSRLKSVGEKWLQKQEGTKGS
jgi:hypothetical protein